MADRGVFERRTTGEARVVWAGSVALASLGWASTVWPVVPGLIFAVLVAVGVAVAARRHAVRVRVARTIREKADAAWEPDPPRHEWVFDGPPVHVVETERDAA